MNAITKHEAGALSLQEADLLNILASSLYPGAAMNSIRMVIGYCKAAGLDPMQKPVHIVPMWDSKAGQMRDVVMPGVGLYRTQAARTGHAGTTEPEYGPDVTETIGGQQVTYPAWCRVTVRRRQACGAVDEFTARELWKENYALKGGKEKSIAPNAMWTKRPYGQIAKCAEAQALRKAFPEIGSQPAAEEMEGKAMQYDDSPAPAQKREDVAAWIAKAQATTTDEAAAAVWAEGGKAFTDTKDRPGYIEFREAVAAHRTSLKDAADAARTVDAEAKEVNAADAGTTEGAGNA